MDKETDTKIDIKNEAGLTDIDKILKAALTGGLLILENGGETYRAEETVMRICAAFGYDESEIVAFPTGMFLSLVKNGSLIKSKVQRVKKRTMNLNKLNEVNNISRALASGGISLDEAIERLNAQKLDAAYSKPLYALIAAVSTAFFSLLYGGTLFDGAVAFVCGFTVQYITSMFRLTDLYKFTISVLGGVIIALFAVSSTTLFDMGSVDKIIIGAIIPLLPGLAMTTAIRDTMVGDLVSGGARMIEVLLIALALAAGVGIVFTGHIALGGTVRQETAAMTGGLILRLTKDLAYCFIASSFFSVLISTPKRGIIPASLLATVGYILYDAVFVTTGREVMAYFIGTLFIAIVGEVMARILKMPSIMFTVPAIVPLVPGVGIYRTMLYLVEDNYSMAVRQGTTTLFIAGAMAVAIAAASILVRDVYARIRKKQ